jgi:hypothetical protein
VRSQSCICLFPPSPNNFLPEPILTKLAIHVEEYLNRTNTVR